MSAPHVWQLVQRWMDGQVIRVNQSQLADALGVGRQTITQWKRGETRPSPVNLRRLHEVTRIPYSDLTAALLRDMGYTDEGEDVGNDERSASKTQAPGSGAPSKDELEELRRRQEEADSAPVEHVTKQAADKREGERGES